MKGWETRASEKWVGVIGVEEGERVWVMVADISRRGVLGRAASSTMSEHECGVGERRSGIERKDE